MSVAVGALIFTYKILYDQKSYGATEVNNLQTMQQGKACFICSILAQFSQFSEDSEL